FGELLVTPEAKALMSIFFATQDLKKDSGVDDPDVEPRAVKRLGVLGGGLRGGGIATMSLTNASVPVRIKGVDDAAVARGLAHLHAQVQKDVERGRPTAAEAERLLHART